MQACKKVYKFVNKPVGKLTDFWNDYKFVQSLPTCMKLYKHVKSCKRVYKLVKEFTNL